MGRPYHLNQRPVLRTVTFEITRRGEILYAAVRDFDRRETTGRMRVLPASIDLNALTESAWSSLDSLLPDLDDLRANLDSYPRARRKLVVNPETGHVWG